MRLQINPVCQRSLRVHLKRDLFTSPGRAPLKALGHKDEDLNSHRRDSAGVRSGGGRPCSYELRLQEHPTLLVRPALQRTASHEDRAQLTVARGTCAPTLAANEANQRDSELVCPPEGESPSVSAARGG